MTLKIKNLTALVISLLGFLGNVYGQNPVTDPDNTAGWILNEAMTDEFDSTALDKSKWWILGENGDYRSKWKGRAPGQFVPHNVLVEDGELIIRSQWEPDYVFLNEKQDGTYYGGTGSASDNSQPITQACVLSEGFVKYGYMEVRMKAADAPVTSAFWAIGYRSEIDMTENYGKRPIANPKNKPVSLERKFRTNIISWEPNLPTGHKQWKKEKDMGVRLSEDYHVFGFEWDRDYVKTYMDGVVVQSATRYDLENYEYSNGKFYNQWVIKHPMELWLDAEVFSWYGLPAAADLATPADHHIDYVRIWQKNISGPEYDAYGFEGPFYFKYWNNENKRSNNWWASNTSKFSITTDKAYDGDASLKYEQTVAITANQTIYAPFGSSDLQGGSNKLTFKIWIEEGCQVNKLTFRLQNPSLKIGDIDISGLARGEWVEVSQSFTRNASITNVEQSDRLYIQVLPANVSGNTNIFYVDEIRFENDNNSWNPSTSVDEINHQIQAKIYPNPAQDVLNISGQELASVSIYNMTGTLVKQVTKLSEPMTVSINDLSSGVYLVRLQTPEGNTRTETLQIR